MTDFGDLLWFLMYKLRIKQVESRSFGHTCSQKTSVRIYLVSIEKQSEELGISLFCENSVNVRLTSLLKMLRNVCIVLLSIRRKM